MPSARILIRDSGLRGPQGDPGTPGSAVGIPTGGTSGQVLAKNSSTNYDTGWVNQTGGGGGGTTAGDTHAATAKATLVDADELPVVDSAASFILKKWTYANLKAQVKAYLDGTGIAKLTTARNINGIPFDGTAAITVADSTKVPTTRLVNGHALSSDVTVTFTDTNAFGYCREVSGVYPGRPAGTGPVMFIGPDQPASGGTTAGGAGFVDQLDFWVIST
jgi:hypothetical protein